MDISESSGGFSLEGGARNLHTMPLNLGTSHKDTYLQGIFKGWSTCSIWKREMTPHQSRERLQRKKKKQCSCLQLPGEAWKSDAVKTSWPPHQPPPGVWHSHPGRGPRAGPHDSRAILAWELVLHIGMLLQKNWKAKTDVSFDLRSGSWERQACRKGGNTHFILSKQSICLLKVGGLLNWCFYKWTSSHVSHSFLPSVLIWVGVSWETFWVLVIFMILPPVLYPPNRNPQVRLEVSFYWWWFSLRTNSGSPMTKHHL